jgi:hypothetical protein
MDRRVGSKAGSQAAVGSEAKPPMLKNDSCAPGIGDRLGNYSVPGRNMAKGWLRRRATRSIRCIRLRWPARRRHFRSGRRTGHGQFNGLYAHKLSLAGQSKIWYGAEECFWALFEAPRAPDSSPAGIVGYRAVSAICTVSYRISNRTHVS